MLVVEQTQYSYSKCIKRALLRDIFRVEVLIFSSFAKIYPINTNNLLFIGGGVVDRGPPGGY